MGKHTPGPWEIHRLRGINDSRGKGHIEILHPLINEDGEYKGQLGGYEVVIGDKNCQRGYILEQANARLIAAAPEMYEALNSIVHFHERKFATLREDIDAFGTILTNARALLARIEGGE
jgi:hypothetical protein